MKYKQFMTTLAKDAGDIMLKYYGDVEVELKEDMSPLTIADTLINSLVIERIKEAYPAHDIYGEEESALENNSNYVWVCDPIDGTFCFAHNIPLFCFSLALTFKGDPIASVVFDPLGKRLCYAEKGFGAYCNDGKITVDKQKMLDHSTIGQVFSWPVAKYDLTHIYSKCRQKRIGVVDFYSIVYMGMLVALGEISACIFPHTKAHDVAALKILIEEAGGKCSDIHGNSQTYDKVVDGFIGSNGLIHKDLVELVKK